MEILKPGLPQSGVDLTGKCSNCGCEVRFNTEDLGVFRNASREDHREWHETSYYVKCPTPKCMSYIYSMAPARRRPTFREWLFS